jgi:hypothetical protein
VRAWRQEHATHEPLIRSIIVEELPLAGLYLMKKQIPGSNEAINKSLEQEKADQQLK